MSGCCYPFEVMYLHSGFITTCCINWLDWGKWSTLPNYDASPRQLWKDAILEELRQRIKDNDYSQCQNCPIFIQRPEYHHIPEDNQISFGWREPEEDPRGPRALYIADSFVCNLKCWSCRPHLITIDNDRDKKEKLLQSIMEEFAPSLRFVNLLGNGELFASSRHIRFLSDFPWLDYPLIKLQLITNGTLLCKNWHKIANSHDRIKFITISVDAATEKTYERVRSGGKWDDLLVGIDFAATLDMDQLQATFVVRAANVHEMAKFAQEMLERGCNNILFSQLAPGYLNDIQYRSQNVFNSKHPNHSILLQQLKDPIFKSDQVNVAGYTEQI
jgi:hypothetical protein